MRLITQQRGACEDAAKLRRGSYAAGFDEALRALVEFARHEGETGTRDPRTRCAAKELRRLYREALE